MAQELGKMPKPEAASFKDKKKLFVVPLVYTWAEAAKGYQELFDRYWQQVEHQLDNLESRIGYIKHIYHESIFEGGEAGLKSLEKVSLPSFRLSQERVSRGASLDVVEDRELVQESLDWERFLMIGFSSHKVANIVSENFSRVMKARYEHVASAIKGSLGDDEAGVLFIREGHMVQFPPEIEVFSVAPPALDEMHRFLRDQPEECDHEEGEHDHGTAKEEKEQSA